MSVIDRPPVEYTVILAFPGFGEEREHAEEIVERALEWLNTNKDEPGFRFAYPVSAHLETVLNVDATRERVETDDSVAMVILHEEDDEDGHALARDCEERDIAVCFTIDAPRPTDDRPPSIRFELRKPPSDEVRAHRICGETLTDPIGDDDEDTGRRVWELIAVLALGVMEHYWRLNPPERLFKIEEIPPQPHGPGGDKN